MEESLRYIFSRLIKIASTEGLRFVRKRILSTFVNILGGLRKFLLLQYLILIVCFLNAFSFFYALYFTFLQFESGIFVFTWPLGFCCALFAATSFLLFYSVREKTWRQALHLEEIVDTIVGYSEPLTEKLDMHEIERMVEKILKAKIQELRTEKRRRKNHHRRHY